MKVPWDRGGLRTYLVLLSLAACRPAPGAIGWALPLLLLGAALHVYAKGCLQQDQVVARNGPYRFVRHPFYTANLLIDVSIAVMSGWWPLMVALPVWWLLVYVPVMREEERHLSALFPEIYPDYARRLPRLFPRRRPLPPEGEGFSWRNSNLVRDTVFSRLLRLLAYPLLFLLCLEVKAAFASSPPANHYLLLVLAAALVTLYGLAWEFKRHVKERARILPPALSTFGARALVAAALLVIAFTLRRAEFEAEPILPLVSAVYLLLSLGLYLARPDLRLVAEGLGMAAIMALCELPWLAAAPLLWYAALALDQRLGPQSAGPAPLARSGAYAVTMAVGVLAATVKALARG